nr:UDP-glucosyl transferase 73B2-like [Tanacetum cinerariifolium]
MEVGSGYVGQRFTVGTREVEDGVTCVDPRAGSGYVGQRFTVGTREVEGGVTCVDPPADPDQEKKVEITSMEGAGEILVVPFFGTGHLNPAMELCKNISSHNYDVTLVIASHLSSSIPSTFTEHSSFIHVAEISDTPPQTPESATQAPPKGCPLHDQNEQMGEGIKSFLSTRSEVKPICVVLDVMMSRSKDIFVHHKIPVVSFFTSGATFSAVDYGK